MGVLEERQSGILPYRDTMKIRFLLVSLIFIFHAALVFGFPFPDVGHTAVAVFFFMSGYGLELSLTRKKGYMGTFLQKRVFGLMIHYWVLMVFVAAASCVFYLTLDGFIPAVETALFTLPHWYVTELLAFYLLFFLSCMIPREKWHLRILFLAVTSIIVMWLSSQYFVSDLYYKSGICFVLGIIFSHLSDRIDGISDRALATLLLPLSVLLVLSFRHGFGLTDMMLVSVTSVLSSVVLVFALRLDFRRYWFVDALMVVAGLVLVMVIGPGTGLNDSGALMLMFTGLTVILCNIRPLSQALVLLGTMSLELYLIHYHTFWFVGNYVQGDVPIILLSAVLTLLLSYLAYRICRSIIEYYNSQIDRMMSQ